MRCGRSQRTRARNALRVLRLGVDGVTWLRQLCKAKLCSVCRGLNRVVLLTPTLFSHKDYAHKSFAVNVLYNRNRQSQLA